MLRKTSLVNPVFAPCAVILLAILSIGFQGGTPTPPRASDGPHWLRAQPSRLPHCHPARQPRRPCSPVCHSEGTRAV